MQSHAVWRKHQRPQDQQRECSTWEQETVSLTDLRPCASARQRLCSSVPDLLTLPMCSPAMVNRMKSQTTYSGSVSYNKQVRPQGHKGTAILLSGYTYYEMCWWGTLPTNMEGVGEEKLSERQKIQFGKLTASTTAVISLKTQGSQFSPRTAHFPTFCFGGGGGGELCHSGFAFNSWNKSCWQAKTCLLNDCYLPLQP